MIKMNLSDFPVKMSASSCARVFHDSGKPVGKGEHLFDLLRNGQLALKNHIHKNINLS